MNIIPVLQGSDEWLALRTKYCTASEASAALGQSKYQSRSELMHQKHTGVVTEVDHARQALFDRGHAAEALARPIAEEIIGTDLYPITASLTVNGIDLLASLDGVDMSEDVIWEHKLYSSALANDVRNGTLAPHYTIQMDQQLLVTGAKKCLFMTSDGTEENMAWCWYESSQEKFDALIAGWTQFAADLAEYQPVQIAEKPVADTIMQLPALAVQIRGEVVLSNLPQFKAAATKFIEGIKTDLETDEDFSNAEATVKFCEKAEKDLELTKSAALGQTASIDELMKTIDFIQAELRTKRLMLSKLVTSKKTEIKEGVLLRAGKAFAQHIESLEAEIKPIRLEYNRPDFAGAAKNKRTLASLNDAVDTELANAKIAVDGIAKGIRAKLAWCKANADGYGFLFNDLQQIVYKADDDFQLLVNTRITEHKKAEEEKAEADRAKIREEEEARARQTVQAEQTPAPAQAAPTEVETQPAEPKSTGWKTIATFSSSKPAPAAAKASRPTDAEIIDVLALHYRVHESKVIEWLLDMDLQHASEQMAAAV